VIAEADLAGHRDAFRFGLHTGELNAIGAPDPVDAVEPGEKIEMPPGAAKLPVGDRLKAGGFLFGNDRADALIFQIAQSRGVQITSLKPGPGVLEGGGPQQTTDLVGAKGWGGGNVSLLECSRY